MAKVIRNNVEVNVSVSELLKGDIVLIKPGESIPVDGVVVSGKTYIDESMLTGESLAVKKEEGSNIFAGTINKNGSIHFRVTSTSENTILSKIITLVEDASSTKAPIAKLADKISYIFVPVVISIAIVSSLIWFIVGSDFSFSLNIFVSVLVIACPCALGLATPTAIIVGMGKGASLGVLFKDAQTLENTYKCSNIVFDKTGTLTIGKPVVTDIISKSISENHLMKYVISGEAKSEHPLSKAITGYGKEHNIEVLEAEDFKAHTGEGISFLVENKKVKIGKASFINIKEDEVSLNLQNQGKTVVFVEIDGKFEGIIAVADKLKEESKKTISTLKSLNIKTTILTGDSKNTALSIGKELGVDEVIYEVLPIDKGDHIKKIKKEGNQVIMVGDGINDAPALAIADIGIAVGSGSDIAIETSDIVLIKNNIYDLINAIDLSKYTVKIIKENLFWAFIYNIIGIPFACGLFYAFGGPLLNPMIAALAMSLSSFCVVMNALRINYFKSRNI